MDEKIIVDSKEPVRIDRFMRRIYPNITQGILEKLLRKGLVKLNQKKTKSNARISYGDVINIRCENLDQYRKSNDNKKSFSRNIVSLADKLLSDYLLFSSENIIAIDKPAGLAVQGGSKISISIDDALQYINSTQSTDFKLVHRLDKETSGVLLIAKDGQAAAKIGNAFKEGSIKKTYIAVICGCPDSLEGTLINNIGKDRSGIFEIVKELSDGGKIAKTQYKVLQSSRSMSLVEFRPLTGRMHQLRFHSKLLGCSILGDEKYGGKKHSRMMLHAKSITINHEIFDKKIIIESKLPEEFTRIVN
ncbi:RluA family pseudouridine synthase [Rickettsiaceae bacterium]|nr:RluA family pseudouridine synthase [Rickettsiaceae bacterium]